LLGEERAVIPLLSEVSASRVAMTSVPYVLNPMELATIDYVLQLESFFYKEDTHPSYFQQRW
jgi:hypothetical protein